MDNIQMLNIDCMEYMKAVPDKYFDLAIVDPPYGIGASEKNNTDKKQSIYSAANSVKYGTQKWDDNIPNPDYFKELKRVTNKQIIWGANYYGLIGGMLFWNKQVTMPTYSRGELAWLSFQNKIDYVEITWHGMIQENMAEKETRIHPTQKPVALYKWLLKNYAKPEMKILDTHGGSFSSAIACYDFGTVEYVGCELDKDYYDAAVKRFNYHKSQQVMDFGVVNG